MEVLTESKQARVTCHKFYGYDNAKANSMSYKKEMPQLINYTCVWVNMSIDHECEGVCVREREERERATRQTITIKLNWRTKAICTKTRLVLIKSTKYVSKFILRWSEGFTDLDFTLQSDTFH